MNVSPPATINNPDNLLCELTSLQQENNKLTAQIEQLKQQLDWFKRQLFGEKSEKRQTIDPAVQPSLLAGLVTDEVPAPVPAQPVAAHTRKRKSRDGSVTDHGLRFDDSVPVEVVEILPDALTGDGADQYEVISHKVTYLLAQRQASYVVIEERRPVFRKKDTGLLTTTPAPARVLDNSLADVSFLAGMLMDKFLYHLPLHRQHQRLTAAGITLSRGVLTQLTAKAVALLKPIADAQHEQVLRSRVLAIDETPVKAGRSGPGKMRQGYFWPLYGDLDELVFCYASSRSGKHLKVILKDFQGTLLSDGYQAYEQYVAGQEGLTHAQCWAHTRRYFEKALKIEPDAANEALAMIGAMYQHERFIREQPLTGKAKQHHRQRHTGPIVQGFWQWCDQQCQRHDLTPTNPLTTALKYAMARKDALQVFLSNPEVAVDTNHLERGLRPVPMGKKNWLFCWTEAGAEDVATIQSLLATCRLQRVNAYDYLVDVLQRVSVHPASQVNQLTPRLWKQHFSENPLRSVVV